MKSACVIGAGLGGLALAIRLQAAGVATTLVEARAAPGGVGCGTGRDGFVFDGGQGVVNDADGLAALFALAGVGADAAPELRPPGLLPIEPFTRFLWPDGATLDVTADKIALHAALARFDPADVAGYEDLARMVAAIRADDQPRFANGLRTDWRALAGAVPALLRHQGWRPFDALVARHVASERLRQALAFPVLRIGGNPLTTPALLAVGLARDPFARVWWVRGGAARLAAALLAAFERLGGTARLGDPVRRIITLGTRATGIETAGGWTAHFEGIGAGVDAVHLYRELLAGTARGARVSRWLARRKHSPAQFVVDFGLKGTWPGIAHRTVLLGARHEGWLTDLFAHGVLPRDLLIELHHPTVSDPTLAPAGMSAFSAVVPVPHLGQLPVDWTQVGPLLEARVIAEIGARLIPDLDRRIVTRAHRTPHDAARDWNAFQGSANGLALTLGRSGVRRMANRDAVIDNLYLVGADAHPGAGMPGVLTGAAITAGLMIEDLR